MADGNLANFVNEWRMALDDDARGRGTLRRVKGGLNAFLEVITCPFE